jgi:uncharacterized protein YraI
VHVEDVANRAVEHHDLSDQRRYGDGKGDQILGTGSTHFFVDVVVSVYDFPTRFYVYTDETTLLGALLGVGLIQGEFTTQGYRVTAVNGVAADGAGTGQRWLLLRYDEALGHVPPETAIEVTSIKDGDLFTFSLESQAEYAYDAPEESSPVQALTIENLATRSGPGTGYRETGTYRVKGKSVVVISRAYDRNDLCWLQCEVLYRDKVRRVYTGLKRFDAASFDLESVPEEAPLDYSAKVTATSKAQYGPGDAYGTYGSLTVDKGQTVTIIAIEGDYAQVEWETTEQKYRAWVPVNTLRY